MSSSSSSTRRCKFRNFSEVPADITDADMQTYLNAEASESVSPSSALESNDKSSSPSKTKSSRITFPANLYNILADPEHHHVIRWLPHGRAWEVVDEGIFLKEVAPKFFSFSKYQSFVRQVTGWQFRRKTSGKDRNSYYHELFMRGRPHLIRFMERETIGEAKNKYKGDDNQDPDFYELSKKFPLPETAASTTIEESSQSSIGSLQQQQSSHAPGNSEASFGEGPGGEGCEYIAGQYLESNNSSHSQSGYQHQHYQSDHYQQRMNPRTAVIDPTSRQARTSWPDTYAPPSYEAQYYNRQQAQDEQYPYRRQGHDSRASVYPHTSMGYSNVGNNDGHMYFPTELLASSFLPHPPNSEWAHNHQSSSTRTHRNEQEQPQDDDHYSQLAACAAAAAAAISPKQSFQDNMHSVKGECKSSATNHQEQTFGIHTEDANSTYYYNNNISEDVSHTNDTPSASNQADNRGEEEDGSPGKKQKLLSALEGDVLADSTLPANSSKKTPTANGDSSPQSGAQSLREESPIPLDLFSPYT